MSGVHTCVDLILHISTLQLLDQRGSRNSHLQVVRDTPNARIIGCVSSLRIEIGDSRWNYSLVCTKVNRVMFVSLCAEAINPVYEGNNI